MIPILPKTSKHHHHIHLDNQNSSATKRNASMIFRIEHLLPVQEQQQQQPHQQISHSIISPSSTSMSPLDRTSPPTTSYLAASNEMVSNAHSSPLPSTHTSSSIKQRSRLLRSGVYVSQFTPKDTVSESINTMALMSFMESSASRESPSATFCTLARDVICMTADILRRIKLSEDIHSYNALFEMHRGENVRIRVVKDIGANDELVAWFGEEVTLLMSIPFLTPLNIQGNKRYTCHLCHLTFETPNPLKIHLALGCGRHSMDILWIRLHYAVKTAAVYATQQLLPRSPESDASTLPSAPTIQTTTTPPPQSQSPSSQSTNTTTSTTTTIQQQQRQESLSPPPPPRFSAFKPISSSTSAATITTHTATTLNFPATLQTPPTIASNQPSFSSFLPTIMSPGTMTSINLLQASNNHTNPMNAAAQIEAIVSNMGTSKQGHLCIYCGKVYSRKYGLKIHIRTHTGFKPLKCKFCLRPFGDPSNLNKHVRLHLQTGASATAMSKDSYNCHLCHKTLARRRDLQRHIESRHTSGSARSSLTEKTS